MLSENELSMLQTLVDKEAIRDCLFRYCRAMDRHDEELARTVYWPEANDHHGAFNGPASEFIKHVMKFTNEMELVAHSLGNIIIELEGDKAKVESYFFGYHRWRIHNGVLTDVFMGGRYLDKMEKRNGEWRTADRYVVYDWFRELPDSADYGNEILGFVATTGAQKPKDHLYAWLGVKS